MRVYQAEVHVITDDDISAEKVEQLLNNALLSVKTLDNIYVREVNYTGNIEEPLEEDAEDCHY